MINRDSRGDWYSIVRGEILGFIEDQLLRKHFSRMFSLISERKLGDRRRSRGSGRSEQGRWMLASLAGLPGVARQHRQIAGIS